MARNDLTAQRLRELFHYDPETGIFVRKIRVRQFPAGIKAGWLRSDGYSSVGVDGTPHLAHRLAWVYVTGDWPENEIDHINGRKSDNRFCNLRDVPHGVNSENILTIYKNSTSKLLGAYFHESGRWRAQISIARKIYHLGMFDSAKLAHAAYLSAKRKSHAGCTI